MGIKWYLTVVLIKILLITSEIENVFINYLSVFSEMCMPVMSPFPIGFLFLLT